MAGAHAEPVRCKAVGQAACGGPSPASPLTGRANARVAAPLANMIWKKPNSVVIALAAK